ncbi:MAG: hypothetical protein ACRD9S_12450 [Pyrinomonadaceae bacterium]
MKKYMRLSLALVIALVALTASLPNAVASSRNLPAIICATTITSAHLPAKFPAKAALIPVGSAAREQGNEGSPKKKAIIGSWMETVTISVPGNPSFKSLSTFTADGGLTVADQGNVNLATDTLYSAGHGSWVNLEGSTIAWTVLELVSDLNGNPMGVLKVSGEYTVDESGDSYTGHFKADQVDTNGTLVFSVEGTNEGHRIKVEPLP